MDLQKNGQKNVIISHNDLKVIRYTVVCISGNMLTIYSNESNENIINILL